MNACDALYEKSEWACEDHPTAANAEEEIRSLPGVKIEDLVRTHQGCRYSAGPQETRGLK